MIVACSGEFFLNTTAESAVAVDLLSLRSGKA